MIKMYWETQFSMYLWRTPCYTFGMGNTVPKWTLCLELINTVETGINPCPCYIIKHGRLSLRTYVDFKRGQGNNKT